MTTYAIAINRHYVGKAPYPAPPGFWAKYNGQFENCSLTIEDFIELVRSGYAYTAWHTSYRKAENFALGQHIALDFDTKDERSTLDALCADPLISRFAAFVYTTPSHTPEGPKARAVFVLDRPIMSGEKYTLLARALVDLYQHADETCKDACRLFYGSKGCDYRVLGNVLSLEAAADHIVAPYKAKVAQAAAEREAKREAARVTYGNVQADDEVKVWYVNAAFDKEHDLVAHAPDGERHKTLLAAAMRLGGLLNTTWIPGGVVSESRIYDTLLSASEKNGEVRDYGQANVEQTIRDGIGYATEPRDEPIWEKREEQVRAAEPSAILPEIALTPEQAEREREALERIRREAWWRGFHAGMGLAAREFWAGIGATTATIDRLQLGYDDEHDGLTIPYFAANGELLNIEYRASVDPDTLVNYEFETPSLLCVQTGHPDQPVLLLEDTLDAIRVAGIPATAAYSIYALPHLMPDKQSLTALAGRVVVVLATDRHEARIAAVHEQAKVVQLPFCVAEMVRRGVGAHELRWYVKQAR